MIAIEVLSPSEGMIAIGTKVAEYLSADSEEGWLIDHENRAVHAACRCRGFFCVTDASFQSPRPGNTPLKRAVSLFRLSYNQRY